MVVPHFTQHKRIKNMNKIAAFSCIILVAFMFTACDEKTKANGEAMTEAAKEFAKSALSEAADTAKAKATEAAEAAKETATDAAVAVKNKAKEKAAEAAEAVATELKKE